MDASGLTVAEAGEILDALAKVATPVTLRFLWQEEARKVAEAEGVALNQFINVAVAEKLSALRTEDYFRERAARGNVSRAKQILEGGGAIHPSRAMN